MSVALFAQTTDDSTTSSLRAQELNTLSPDQRKAAWVKDPTVVSTLEEEALALTQKGKYAEALPYIENAVALRRQSTPPAPIELAASLTLLANVHHSLKADERAEPLYQEAKALLEKIGGTKMLVYAQILEGLSDLARTTHDPERAKELRTQSRQIIEQIKSIDSASEPSRVITKNLKIEVIAPTPEQGQTAHSGASRPPQVGPPDSTLDSASRALASIELLQTQKNGTTQNASSSAETSTPAQESGVDAELAKLTRKCNRVFWQFSRRNRLCLAVWLPPCATQKI